jgi:hypothetical protein
VLATISILCVNASEPNPLEIWVDGPFEPSPGAGWDTGELTLFAVNSDGERKSLTVVFEGRRYENLASLVLTGDDWTLDLSNYVGSLPSPFPSRIVVKGLDWSTTGTLDSLLIELPFETPGVDGNQCMFQTFVIKARQIVDSYQAPTTRTYCWL